MPNNDRLKVIKNDNVALLFELTVLDKVYRSMIM